MSTTTPAVRAANSRKARERHRLRCYGQWDPFRDAEPVRQYVRKLMSTGLSVERIAAGSGVTLAVVDGLLYGSGDNPPTVKIRTENAVKIMAYRPTPDHYAPNALRDVTGSRRRLQALATLGWSRPVLAARYNIHRERLETMAEKKQKTTTVANARVVAAMYDDLWHRVPTADEVAPWIATRTRNFAARMGFAGPLAWDDESIDDPKARPRRGRKHDPISVDMAKVIRRLEGEDIELNAWENTAAIEYGVRTRGLAYVDVAEFLGMELDSVKRSWERVKERARAAGETWPDSPRWTDPALTARTEPPTRAAA
ncbi:hypothetical protein ACIA7S_28610 [Streptomyces sp. NPDC051643]|uniref:hypothetical protein n=1 Tax=Streptomyces sp. NPDC051643 TaxID=3365665 RepID=UPI0037A98F6F